MLLHIYHAVANMLVMYLSEFLAVSVVRNICYYEMCSILKGRDRTLAQVIEQPEYYQ